MAAVILRSVLSFAVWMVSWWIDDLCARLSGSFIVTVNICHAHHNGKRGGHFTNLLSHNDGTLPERELRAMIADLQTLLETEGSTQPVSCLTDIGIGEFRNDRSDSPQRVPCSRSQWGILPGIPFLHFYDTPI